MLMLVNELWSSFRWRGIEPQTVCLQNRCTIRYTNQLVLNNRCILIFYYQYSHFQADNPKLVIWFQNSMLDEGALTMGFEAGKLINFQWPLTFTQIRAWFGSRQLILWLMFRWDHFLHCHSLLMKWWYLYWSAVSLLFTVEHPKLMR